MLRAYGVTDKGRVRPTNEDCFAIDDALGLCVIADGMGGHNAGEVAAQMAVDAVVEHVRESSATQPIWPFGFRPGLSEQANILRTAILLANIQILEAAISGAAYAGMGTTVVAAQAVDGRLIVAHAGDSRLYLLRPSGLSQLTADDSWGATVLASAPDADPLLLQHHPMRHALTNVVGAHSRTAVHVTEETLTGGELLLLTTDGVHGVLDNRRLEDLLRADDDPRTIATEVIATALRRGSRDNCTAVVARYARTPALQMAER